MTKYVIDAWAWIEYFDGSSQGEIVKKYVESEANIIFTNAVTVSEIVSKFLRAQKEFMPVLTAIKTLSRIVPVDTEMAQAAGTNHARMRRQIHDFGLADAYVLATSQICGGKIVTGDKHFLTVKDAIVLQ